MNKLVVYLFAALLPAILPGAAASQTSEDYARRGADSYRKADYTNAIISLNKAISLNPYLEEELSPYLARAHFKRAAVHSYNGNHPRAVADLDAPGGASRLLSGGPLARQALRAVPGELDRDALARLMRHVEANADQVGQVTEALGGTQWTARDRFRTTQVSITPADGETRVRVVERFTPRYRRLLQLMPPWVGVCVASAAVGALQAGGAVAPALLAAGAAAGGVVGRILWGRFSRESADRVERLAAGLAQEAESLPRGGGARP